MQLGASEIRTWNAEARCARLQQVAEAAKPFAQPHDTTFAQYEALREALAGLDMPAEEEA